MEEQIKELRDKINYHSDRYYNQDSPEISDYEFDMLMQQLKKLEKEHPELVTKDSPTQHVGGTAKRTAGVLVHHNVPMLSLQDVFSKEEVVDFVEQMKEQLDDPEFVVEYKIDGLSMALRYENGDLSLALTRGDGVNFGEDVTANAKVISDVKKKLKDKPEYLEIRICLDRTEIFKTQLRAIYRASYYGTIAIMFPMIISVNEVKKIKEIIAEVKAGLDADGIPYKDVELGIMIETPAAVMISDLLAKEVDFFSIGTNDLTQYTLAIDRQNPKLDNIYDSHHEAVLRMLKMVVDNGHKEGCWVGICGELGADETLTETFLRMGFDELSVSPSMILRIRDKIRNTDLSVK